MDKFMALRRERSRPSRRGSESGDELLYHHSRQRHGSQRVCERASFSFGRARRSFLGFKGSACRGRLYWITFVFDTLVLSLHQSSYSLKTVAAASSSPRTMLLTLSSLGSILHLNALGAERKPGE